MAEVSVFYSEIKAILTEARQRARTAVNTAMVEAYWHIGKRIVEEEQGGKGRAGYGDELIRGLSVSLTDDLGKGFSYANLCNFRQFYLTFPDSEILYALRRELTWTNLRMIMRVENPQARAYYLQEASEQGWSSRDLQRLINTHTYERTLSSQGSAQKLATQEDHTESARDFIKDPYVLEFLQLPESPWPKEQQIESAIIANLSQFLLEAGKGFSFVGRQFRISTETAHFYIDLVFYNYLLKCFVLIDLKADALSHQDIGQMDTYVRMFDDLKRAPDDNPTIGLILCASKDETLVKYSLLKDSEQIFASKYRLVLPTEEELIAEIDREKRLFLEQQGAGR